MSLDQEELNLGSAGNHTPSRTQKMYRYIYHIYRRLPGGSDVKASAMWQTRLQSLGWEDPLEKEMATHSSTHAWKISWMEKPGGLQSMGLQRVGHN